MSNLTILETSISQLDNLYSLNKVHIASGSKSKHQPTFFIRLDTTQELIAEIQRQDPNSTPLRSINGGKTRGTYACKELVIAYAAWISPAFHLTVLRAFLNQVENSQNPQPNLPLVEPPKMFKRELTEKEMQDLCWAWYALRNYIELTDTLQKQFGGFGGDYAYAIRQLNERYRNLPQEILPVLQRITAEFKPDNIHGNGWERILHSVQHPNTLFRVGRLIHLF